MASFLLLLSLLSLLGQSEAAVTATLKTNTWTGGGQGQVILQNTGSKPVCAVTFQLTTPTGMTVTSSWNMDSAGNNQYKTPSYMNIPAGGQFTDPGFVYTGSGTPTVSVMSSTECGGGSSGGGGSGGGGGGGGSPTTTPPPPPTTTAPAGGGGGGSSGGSCCPNGKLSVKGTQLVGSDGTPVQLRGMSLFWSNFPEGSPFFNEQTVQCLHCKWNANIVRAPMGVENAGGDNGYLNDPTTQYNRELAVVNAAIKNCMYVLVDWHYTSSQAYTSQAVDFFKKISAVCAGKCNCLYETWNEPTQNDWNSQLKPYHEEVIKAIRQNDPDGVVIAGTPTWDQDVDKAAANPITDQKNVMYTLHFYAGEGAHDDPLRQKAQAAINAGLPLFVTEYGTTGASGDGTPNLAETQKWYDLLDKNKVSYINWSVSSKSEQSSALGSGATPADVCSGGHLTTSGSFVKQNLQQKNPAPKGC